MAKRRLQLMMDLADRNSNNSVENNDHNTNNHNLADIISTATIVFGEPEINPVIEIGNNQTQNNLMFQNVHFDNSEMNVVNCDINIEQDNEVLAILLESNIDNLMFQNAHIDNFEVNTVNSNINIEEDNEVLDISLENNIPLYEILTENILKSNDINNENKQMDVENINVNDDVNTIIQSKRNDTLSIKPQPNKWKRITSQRLRMNGQEYIGFQRKGNVVSQDVQRPARNIQPTCESKFCIKAKNRFCQSFDANQRLEIFSTFWNSSWEVKKTFSCNMVTKITSKSSTTGCNDSSRRSNTYTYHLKYKDLPALQVCKKMFLGTLGMNEFMLHSWVNESNHGIPKKSKNMSYDNSGQIIKLSPQNVARRAFFCERLKHLKNWFNSLAKMPSHNCRDRTNRLYLEGPFDSLQEVFICYKKNVLRISLFPSANVFLLNTQKKYEVSIFKPRKDQCDLCSSHENCQVSEEYTKHIALKNRAREEKQKDKTNAEKKSVTVLLSICKQSNNVLQ